MWVGLASGVDRPQPAAAEVERLPCWLLFSSPAYAKLVLASTCDRCPKGRHESHSCVHNARWVGCEWELLERVASSPGVPSHPTSAQAECNLRAEKKGRLCQARRQWKDSNSRIWRTWTQLREERVNVLATRWKAEDEEAPGPRREVARLFDYTREIW